MNFKSFITEETLTNENILDLIRRDCSDFLKESQGYYLYRGMPKQSDEFIKITPRTDRKPKNSSPVVHDMFNEAFYERHGVKDIRSRAIFCTGSEYDSEIYSHGKISYIIFPVDGYTYWWGQESSDVFIDYRDFLIKNDYKYSPLAGEYPDGSMEEFIDFAEYTNTNLVRGIKSKNEIMILCKEYYGIRLDTKVDIEKLFKNINI